MSARQLVAASLVLVAFTGLTGLALDRAFRNSALAGVQDRLLAQIYLLLGVAELDADGRLTLPPLLPEARFSTPGSGLYAAVVAADGQTVWRSDSTLGQNLDFAAGAVPGVPEYTDLEAKGETLFALRFTVDWETQPQVAKRYSFWVAEHPQRFDSAVDGFRRSLGGWLLGGALGLLAAQGLVLRWSLTPLRQVAREIQDIEAGRQLTLAGHYPAELQPLTRNLNQLVSRSRDHLERYRNTLGDLAHSLKTPLAVLGSSLETGADDLKHTVREQVVRMNQTVDYQLQRAAAAGRIALTAPVPVSAAAQQIVHSLAKVYSDKGLDFQWQVADELVFNGDRGDLLEVLGNLMDNACKWAAKTVRLRAWPLATSGDVVLVVEDDGPGIPDHRRATILQRGVRADPHTAGHGIGLAVVRELVEDIYRGQLTIDDSPLGGARIRAVLAMDP